MSGPPDAHFQTVPIRKGRHDSPARGACVMELSSMLAGERFGDHPQSVCPVIAAFLRSYNDLLPDGQHDELYPYAALVVGTAGRRAVRYQRARRILELAGSSRRRSVRLRLQTWDLVLLPAVEAALRMDTERRRVVVAALLDELCAMGRAPDAHVPAASPAALEGAAGADARPVTPPVR